jgi:tyrosine-protein phosphatase SIW14
MMKFLLATILFSGLFLVLALPTLVADMHENAKNVKRLGKVDENLYRGGQPTYEGLKELQKMGIKRIINFRYEKDLIAKEREQVESLGMEYISLPWAIFASYNHDVFEAFFDAIKDKDEKPTFFHCKRGSERTGVAAGAYMIRTQNASVDEAFKEIQKYDIKFYWSPFVKNALRAFYKHEHEKK